VVEATEILKNRAVNFDYDGELQADAALVDAIGKLKSPS
jgi:phosphate acetyltransferase